MFKKIYTVLFLLFLAAMPLLYSFYAIFEKKMIEYRMEKKLAKENLQIITLDAFSVVWMKKNKEILVNGESFDVKSMTRSGNNIVFTGLFDFWEKDLKKKLEAYQHSEKSKSSTANSMVLLIFLNYCQVAESINMNAPVVIQKKPAGQVSKDKIRSLYTDIIIPPPRFV